jgi:hypothetical protein
MDLLQELRRKVSEIDPHDKVDGINAAIRHIELADRFLSRARSEHDPDLFNDVIYRTNQAFEGMLKEAYAVLEDSDASRLSPNEIEQHFLTTKRLTERVLVLFKNYRQQWRNPATHDHTLLFSEQEALLGIVSVSAFAVVLLDQIVETISFKRQRAATSRKSEQVAAKLHLTGRSLAEQTVEFVEYFLQHERDARRTFRSEAELVGALSGFLVGLDLGIDVLPNARMADRRVDLLVIRGKEKVVIEVKYGRFKQDYIAATLAQIRAYVIAASASGGILLFASSETIDATAQRLPEEDSGMELWIIGAQLR